MTIYTTTVVTIAMLFLGLAHASDDRNWEVGLTQEQVATITKLFNDELSEYQTSELDERALDIAIFKKLRSKRQPAVVWQAFITFARQLNELDRTPKERRILDYAISAAIWLKDA